MVEAPEYIEDAINSFRLRSPVEPTHILLYEPFYQAVLKGMKEGGALQVVPCDMPVLFGLKVLVVPTHALSGYDKYMQEILLWRGVIILSLLGE